MEWIFNHGINFKEWFIFSDVIYWLADGCHLDAKYYAMVDVISEDANILLNIWKECGLISKTDNKNIDIWIETS
jgi:hypothetical protein